jgi:hypothetical protein
MPHSVIQRVRMNGVEVKVRVSARLAVYNQFVRLGVKPLRPTSRDIYIFQLNLAVLVLT